MPLFVYQRPRETAELERHPSLRPHASYLRHFDGSVERVRTTDPAAADAFVVPVNLVHWQFSQKHPDPCRYIESLPFLGRRLHVVMGTGDFGQRERSQWESTAEGRAYPSRYEWLDACFGILGFEWKTGL